MQLPANVAQQFDQGTFDMGVNVLQFGGELELTPLDLPTDGFQRVDNFLSFRLGKQADFGQHASVSLTGLDVLLIEPAVDADRFGERFDALVGAALKSPAPGFLAHRNHNPKERK